MQLSAAETDLIVKSYRALASDGTAAAVCFYQHLFRIAPETRSLFVTDTQRQSAKMASTLSLIVDLIQNWGLLRGIIEDLALRHVAYGIEARHYDIGGAALMAMLAERLGPDFTPDTATAWAKAYAAIQHTMAAHARPPSDIEDDEAAPLLDRIAI